MKQVAILLSILFCFAACSSDNDDAPNSVSIPHGVFLSVDGTQMIGVYIYDGQCTQIHIYQSNGNQYYVDGFSTSGNWPNYKYTSTDGQFTMSVKYSDNANEFVANYNGKLTGVSVAYNSQMETFSLNGNNQRFTYSNGVLDANGNGIPDALENN